MKPKKSKHIIFLLALLMCMSVFVFPVAAAAEVAPPAVEAEIIGSLLRIHATSGFFEVEAVYVNGRRFNHRVDSALVIDISQYIATGDTIAVHAVDFAGNHSDTVLLTPPPPALPPAPNNITPDGQGELLDHLTSEDNVEFITIETPAGNIFYLLIDHTRSSNNVYFLNPVTEWDLLTLAAEAELTVPIHMFEIPPACDEPVVIEVELPDTTEIEPEPEQDEDESGGQAGIFIFLAVAGAGAFGAVYYFKILKPKKDQEMYGDGNDEESVFENVDDNDDSENAYDVDNNKNISNEEDESV
jgi:hypothetical protein